MPPPHGSTLNSPITVASVGPDDAPDMVMTDHLPYGTSFQAITATGWTCSSPAPGTLGGTVTCTVNPLVTATVVASNGGVEVRAQPNRGVLTNSVTLSSDACDPNLSNSTASVSTNTTIARKVVAASGK